MQSKARKELARTLGVSTSTLNAAIKRMKRTYGDVAENRLRAWRCPNCGNIIIYDSSKSYMPLGASYCGLCAPSPPKCDGEWHGE